LGQPRGLEASKTQTSTTVEGEGRFALVGEEKVMREKNPEFVWQTLVKEKKLGNIICSIGVGRTRGGEKRHGGIVIGAGSKIGKKKAFF